MISDALVFLKNQLNGYLTVGADPAESQEEIVVFAEEQNSEGTNFRTESISILLINVEEDNTFRTPNQFVRKAANGDHQTITPELCLNLQILLVSRFQRYQTSLSYLSKIIQYFQKYRAFNDQNASLLPDNIQKLVVELAPLSISTQNEIWSILRTAYQPSVSYKVKMVVFETKDPQSTIPIQTTEVEFLK